MKSNLLKYSNYTIKNTEMDCINIRTFLYIPCIYLIYTQRMYIGKEKGPFLFLDLFCGDLTTLTIL